MYVSTGNTVFAVGANNVDISVSNSVSAPVANIVSLSSNTITANVVTAVNISANGTTGSFDQILTTDGNRIYWATRVGYTGSIGYTGSLGYTGSQGDTGYTGSLGYTGSKGILTSRITANTTLSIDTSYIVDTSGGAVSLTLPASPSQSDFIVLTDGHDWSANKVTVLRNGNNIAGFAEDLDITTKGVTVWFQYNGGSDGWIVTANLGPTGYTGSGGGGLYSQVLTAVPTLASTGLSSTFNFSNATVSDSAAGIVISGLETGGTNVRGIYKTAPATPYTITALVTQTGPTSSYAFTGIGFYDPITGRIENICYTAIPSVQPNVSVPAFYSATSYSNNVGTLWPDSANINLPIWLRLQNDGTNVTYSYSADGVNFWQLVQFALSSGYGTFLDRSTVGFQVNTQSNEGVQMFGTLMQWKET
jgi:hypothetical protein